MVLLSILTITLVTVLAATVGAAPTSETEDVAVPAPSKVEKTDSDNGADPLETSETGHFRRKRIWKSLLKGLYGLGSYGLGGYGLGGSGFGGSGLGGYGLDLLLSGGGGKHHHGGSKGHHGGGHGGGGYGHGYGEGYGYGGGYGLGHDGYGYHRGHGGGLYDGGYIDHGYDYHEGFPHFGVDGHTLGTDHTWDHGGGALGPWGSSWGLHDGYGWGVWLCLLAIIVLAAGEPPSVPWQPHTYTVPIVLPGYSFPPGWPFPAGLPLPAGFPYSVDGYLSILPSLIDQFNRNIAATANQVAASAASAASFAPLAAFYAAAG